MPFHYILTAQLSEGKCRTAAHFHKLVSQLEQGYADRRRRRGSRHSRGSECLQPNHSHRDNMLIAGRMSVDHAMSHNGTAMMSPAMQCKATKKPRVRSCQVKGMNFEESPDGLLAFRRLLELLGCDLVHEVAQPLLDDVEGDFLGVTSAAARPLHCCSC